MLDNHLPATLPLGCGTAIFCYGHCFHRDAQVASLELVVGGVRHRPTAARMPRRDLYEWLHGAHGAGADPAGHSYRSGFWATLPVRAQERVGPLEIEALVRLDGGTEILVPLGQIEIVAAVSNLAAGGAWQGLAAGTIAVCMATYEPDPSLLRTQIESLRAQTDTRWICVISDGGSSRKRFEEIVSVIDGDDRFRVSRSDRRLDPYRNFERALTLAPAGAELIALCDQDDRWYPDKLGALRCGLGSSMLVYSDQRLIDDAGRLLRDSLWEGRRNDRENLASLLVANTVPGAAMLLRRELLGVALPFPEAPGVQYHDHWLALAALAAGSIAYVDRPLYDYVQHAAAVQGATGRVRTITPRRLRRGSRGWRGAYFGGYVNRQVWASTLLVRCGQALPRRKRRALSWFVAADRALPYYAWLALRPLRRMLGRDETLGGEIALTAGLQWRRLIVLAVGRAKRPGRRAYDASFPNPPEFEQRRLRRWRAGA